MRVELHGVSKEYTSARGKVAALADVNLAAEQGEFIALLGPSGCGKTTLLRLIAGTLAPDTGEIRFSGWRHTPIRRLVFQENSLFPWMTVVDNVAFGLEMARTAKAQRHAAALGLLARMGMAGFANHYPHELSGGMRQRAAIARAFLCEPDVLLMDEPLRALDAQMQLIIQEELLRLWQERCPLVFYVTHDLEEALLLADRVMVFRGRPGSIRQEFKVSVDRPRARTLRSHPELEDLKWHIWSILEEEVRQKLQQPE